MCFGPKNPDIAPHQAVDLLTLLVEKSLVNVSMTGGRTRYSLLETIRQYAAAKLAEAGEEEDVRRAHRDHFLQAAVGLSKLADGREGEQAFAAFVGDRENFEVAFRWSCARVHFEEAARFLGASHDLLAAIWVAEAIGWARAVMPSIERVPEPARTDVLYRCAPWLALLGPQPPEPLLRDCIDFHRKSGDELHLVRALLAWVQLTSTKDEMTGVLEEAVEITERLSDLHATITAKAHSVFRLGIEDQDRKDRYLDDLVRELNEADAPVVRFLPGSFPILSTLLWEDIVRSIAFSEPIAARDFERLSSLARHSFTLRPMALVFAGRYVEAEALAEKLIRDREDVGDLVCISSLYMTMAFSTEARDDTDAALAHSQRSFDAYSKTPFPTAVTEIAGAILRLGGGEVDQGVRVRDKFTPEALCGDPDGPMYWTVLSGATRYLQGEIEQAEEQAHKTIAEAGANWLLLDSSFDLLAAIAVQDNSYIEATRLLAGAAAHRDRIGVKWGYRVFRDIRNDTIEKIKEALSPEEFDHAWLEGSAMTIQQTVGYAQRGRGERKRPPAGWRSLTPTEQQVVDFLAEGLSNKEVAEKMFVSVRTITTHLTHIYSKLGVTSRTELVALATKRAQRR